MNPTRIVVHNTANDASARNEIQYMINNKNEVSYHYAIDDKEIIQGIPENRNAWHAGDGGSGVGNRQGIAIEICYSKSGGTRFDAAEILASKFIAFKLKEKGWGIGQVTKHQDYSNKYCPHRTLDKGWQRFLNMIQAELNVLNGQPSTSVQNGALEAYNGFVEITYGGSDGIVLHCKPSWDNSTECGVVKKGEVFTVVGRQLVGGVYMYKLKSGKWITSAKEYVSFRTTLHEGGSKPAAPKPSKSITQLAKEVIAGAWGTGQERKYRLAVAGYDYNAVQAEVNRQLGGSAVSSGMTARQFALEVWNEGKHGSGATREANAKRLGVNYAEAQRLINILANGGKI